MPAAFDLQQALRDAARVIGGVELGEIPKDRRTVVNFLLKIVDPDRKATIKRLISEGKTDDAVRLLRTQLGGRERMKRLEIAGGLRKLRETERQKRKTLQLKPALAARAYTSKELARAGVEERLRTKRLRLIGGEEEAMRKVLKDRGPSDTVSARIKAMEEGTPEQKAAKGRLEAEFLEERTRLDSRVRGYIRKAGLGEMAPEQAPAIYDEAHRTGRATKHTSVAGRELYQPLRLRKAVERIQTRELMGAGLTAGATEFPAKSPLRLPVPVPSPEDLVKMAETQGAMSTRGLLRGQAAAKGPLHGWAKLGAGGLGAVALLTLISALRGKKEPQMNPMLQLQLLQQIQQMQQEGMLTESLVGSRAASAEQAAARAALLRLQAAQLGGVGSNVLV